MYEHIVKKVLDYPTRYTGSFRVTNAKTKLIQNITQSNEIRFGNFLEEIVTDYIALLGYTNLPKRFTSDMDNSVLSADQLFRDSDNTIYLIEQKVRDDHDSTKKRGQIENFIKKVEPLKSFYPDKNLECVMWFIDDCSTKKHKILSQQFSGMFIR